VKGKIFGMAMLSLFFYSCAAQTQFNGTLATFAQYERINTRGVYPQEEQKIIDNQIKPIIEAFELPVPLKPFEDRKNDTLSINYFRAIAGGGTAPNFTIERNGKKLNEVSDTVQFGDTISFSSPQTEGIPTTGDWINPGGSYQDPPAKIVSNARMQEIKNSAEAAFRARYPFAEKRGTLPVITVPKFSAEKTKFNSSTGKYIASNGDPAYIVPAGNGKKFGVQVYCTARITAHGTSRQNYLYCNNLPDKIECPIKAKGTVNISLDESLTCLTIIDKVFSGENAIQADWALDGPSYHTTQGVKLQVLVGNKKPPLADFDCKTIEENNQKFLDCDASKSRDPDGTITKYEWRPRYQNCNSKKCKIPIYSYSTVTLTVTDNEGFYDTKTRTFSLSQMPTYNTTQGQQAPAKPAQEPIPELTATYNKQTKMVEVTAKCDSQKINISINNAITGESILEKQPIKCGQTTPIGPIKVKAAYKVSATNKPKITPAIFTIS